MSRDQRPRREVMIDAPPDVPEPKTEQAAPALPVSPKSKLLLPSILFLLACAAGAVGIALLPSGAMP